MSAVVEQFLNAWLVRVTREHALVHPNLAAVGLDREVDSQALKVGKQLVTGVRVERLIVVVLMQPLTGKLPLNGV